ncbi:hypothetical protein [Streptomyces sp. KLOTTS4A1]|uniref:hypothetical protein n=1 Tax=Streptomyces sp. KLOTTS4A1 TaxID=3390996 RepID=UPI0039F5684D
MGLGGQAHIANRSQGAIERYRPYFDNGPFGIQTPLEDWVKATPSSVGSPQQVIEDTLHFQ